MPMAAAAPDVSKLPPNGLWAKGTAPQERFEAFTDWVRAVKLSTLHSLEKQGTASIEDVQSARDAFQQIGSALEESSPKFPSPDPYISKLFDDFRSRHPDFHWYITSYTITYRTGMTDLASYADRNPGGIRNNYTHEEGVVDKTLRHLMGGFEKIEKKVISSLQQPGPASTQVDVEKTGWFRKKKQPMNVAIEELFAEQEARLSFLASKASQVKQDSFTVNTAWTFWNPFG